MKALYLWLVLQLCAALIPCVTRKASEAAEVKPFSGWPKQFAGSDLEPLPLSDTEERFSRDFHGKLGKFTDGSREILVRWLSTPSRSLHPAADCLKGSGYSVSPRPVLVDREGLRWGCVHAERKAKQLMVCERIYDDEGNSWTDTSSWFWAAMLGRTKGPWWAMTVASES